MLPSAKTTNTTLALLRAFAWTDFETRRLARASFFLNFAAVTGFQGIAGRGLLSPPSLAIFAVSASSPSVNAPSVALGCGDPTVALGLALGIGGWAAWAGGAAALGAWLGDAAGSLLVATV
ncbi:hypothetical protein ACVOMV_12300 [Mesorhizobium atlanticum]